MSPADLAQAAQEECAQLGISICVGHLKRVPGPLVPLIGQLGRFGTEYQRFALALMQRARIFEVHAREQPNAANRGLEDHRAGEYLLALRRVGRGHVRSTGDIARPDDHREVVRVDPILPFQILDVADGDGHLLAGLDVGDRLCKYVGAFLIEEAGDVAGLFGGLVDLPRLLAGFDLPADNPLADGHGHVVDGGVLTEREDVDGLDFVVVGVVKLLCNFHPGDVAGYLDVHVSVLERAGAQLLTFGSERLQHALAHIRSRLHRWDDSENGPSTCQTDCNTVPHDSGSFV